jgi:hypothetical protein
MRTTTINLLNSLWAMPLLEQACHMSVVTMSSANMPWSFYATLVSFAIFFASLNIYLFTLWLAHPLASPLWLIGVVVGGVLLVYSIRMVRIHQAELVEKKRQETSTEAIGHD